MAPDIMLNGFRIYLYERARRWVQCSTHIEVASKHFLRWTCSYFWFQCFLPLSGTCSCFWVIYNISSFLFLGVHKWCISLLFENFTSQTFKDKKLKTIKVINVIGVNDRNSFNVWSHLSLRMCMYYAWWMTITYTRWCFCFNEMQDDVVIIHMQVDVVRTTYIRKTMCFFQRNLDNTYTSLLV